MLTRLAIRKADGEPLDAVVIETSGRARPAPLAQSFFIDDMCKVRASFRERSKVQSMMPLL